MDQNAGGKKVSVLFSRKNWNHKIGDLKIKKCKSNFNEFLGKKIV